MFRIIFAWMPEPILTLTLAALGVFAVVVVAKLFRLLLDLIPFV